jgi:hypothetical protein
MQTVRLILKVNRFEIAVLAIALLLVAFGSIYVADRLTALPGEIASCQDPSACLALQEALARLKLQSTAFPVLGVGLSIFAGVVMGVPITAREVERGTASLAWTMSPSRRVWFLRRVVILAALLAAMSVPPASALERLAAALYPGTDLNHSFLDVDTRGPIIVARALTALGISALAGTVMGRVLPGILVALCACAALFFGLQLVDDAWLRADAVPLPASPQVLDSLIFDVAYELPDGRVVDWATARATLEDPPENFADVFPERYIGVSVDVAPEKRAREIGVILGVGLAMVTAASFVVMRRRPY